jgi:DNA-binding CsgD family transcriptional regulator
MNQSDLNHICLLSEKIKEFSDPVLKNIGVTYTHHTRVFNDGKSFLLTNNTRYLQYFLQKNFALPGLGIYTKPGLHLWSAITALQHYDSQVLDMHKYFNIDHQMAVVYVDKQFVDIFALGSTPNNPEMINYYLNNMDSFDRFFSLYKETFAPDLLELGKRPFAIPLRPKDFVRKKQMQNDFANITVREFECLQHLSHGLTAKMIARELNISPRTVERHIDNIREKLQLKCKLDIINKYKEYMAQ